MTAVYRYQLEDNTKNNEIQDKNIPVSLNFWFFDSNIDFILRKLRKQKQNRT